MKTGKAEFFLLMLFAAASLHAALLFLLPDISLRAAEKPAKREVPPVEISLSFPPPPAPVLPAPPVPPPPSAAAPEPAASPAPEIVEAAAADTAAPAPETAAREPAALGTSAAPGPPEAAPPAPSRADLLSQYQGMIRLLIDQRKEYPYQARRQDQEGKVEIRFVLSHQGRLVGEPALEKRSRYQRLNSAALEAVKNAAPYPPFPPEFPEEELAFSVTVAFSLR
jgi:protein TonB